MYEPWIRLSIRFGLELTLILEFQFAFRTVDLSGSLEFKFWIQV